MSCLRRGSERVSSSESRPNHSRASPASIVLAGLALEWSDLDSLELTLSDPRLKQDIYSYLAEQVYRREVGVDVLLEAGVREGQLQRVEVEPLKGQAGEHDARRPALGQRDQALDVLAARLVAGACGEHRHCLLRVEAQSLGAYRGDVAGETHLVHRERGIVSREHDETQARREIGQKVVQRAIELCGLGRLVVVVEDDVDIAVDPLLALLDEHRLHVLDGEGGLGSGPQAFADRVAEVREARSEGFGERREEDDGVVVENVQLVPDAVETQALDGRRGDCGLAVAGGRADQRQPSSCGPSEVGERVGAQDDVVYTWAGEFRRHRAWS